MLCQDNTSLDRQLHLVLYVCTNLYTCVCVYVCVWLSTKMAHLLACSVKMAHLWTDSCILCYTCVRTCVWLSAKMAHLFTHVRCCRGLSQYHLDIHSNSDTRDVHVQSMYVCLPYTHIHHMTIMCRVATHNVNGSLCQTIHVSHSNCGSTCTVHVLPLSPLPPSVRVSL